MTPLELSTHLSSLLSANPAPPHAPATPSPAGIPAANDFNQHLLRFTRPANSSTTAPAPPVTDHAQTVHGNHLGGSTPAKAPAHAAEHSKTSARASDARPSSAPRSDKPASTSSKADAPRSDRTARDRAGDSNTQSSNNSYNRSSDAAHSTPADSTARRSDAPAVHGQTSPPKSAAGELSASGSDVPTVDAQAISDATATAAGLAIHVPGNALPAPTPVAAPSTDVALTAATTVDPLSSTKSAATNSNTSADTSPSANTSASSTGPAAATPPATLASSAAPAPSQPTIAGSATATPPTDFIVNAPASDFTAAPSAASTIDANAATTTAPAATALPQATANSATANSATANSATADRSPATDVRATTADRAANVAPLSTTAQAPADSASASAPAATDSESTVAAPPKPAAPRRARDVKSGAGDDATAVPTPNQPLAVDVPHAAIVSPDKTNVRADERSGQHVDRAAAALDRLSDKSPLDSQTPQANSAVKLAAGGSAKAGDAQPSTLSEADRARFVQRVARAVQSADAQNGPVRIRLSPPELGAMKIEVTVRDGVMFAKVETETPQARTALMDNLPQLRERLAEQNIKVERFDVDLMNQQSPGGTPDQRFIEATNASNRNRIRSGSAPSAGGSLPTSAAQLNNGQLNVII